MMERRWEVGVRESVFLTDGAAWNGTRFDWEGVRCDPSEKASEQARKYDNQATPTQSFKEKCCYYFRTYRSVQKNTVPSYNLVRPVDLQHMVESI